jgi:translocation and assembly module TamB
VFAGNRVEIQRLHVGSRSGPLDLTGWVQTAGTALQQVNLSLQARDFTAVHTGMLEAVISADMAVRGSMEAMTAAGNVTVSRARVLLEGIPGTGRKAVEPWELTVQGVYGPGPETVAANGARGNGPPRPVVPLPFLRANIHVNLPRNVWVHAPGTAIEAGGELDITKELGQPFVLSGSIATIRGFAGFYGKRFVVQQGEVTFTGTPEINPLLNVRVTHEVSDYVVTIQVEGRASKPEIVFSSTPELPQTDILSLLIVGKTSDRLTSSEQGAFSSQLQQFAGSFIAGRLEKVLGAPLGFDVVEVTPGEGLGVGGISVGRYVTQDIFLSFEREFKDEGGNKVNVEYSITPRLKLRGSSSDTGESSVDFLWRKDY